MNRYALILIALFFTGCATMPPEPSTEELIEKPSIMEEKKAGIGDTFFEQEKYLNMDRVFVGKMSFGVGRFDLTILELNNEKISLQYAEYTQQYTTPSQYAPSMPIRGAWLIKQGFNKTFTYSPKETIRFKGYEFEPISVTNGQLTYKRTK